MAKGNIGNLLQHYVGLEAAHRLAARGDAFDFIDLFAMAPWEPLATTTVGFKQTLAACDTRQGDPISDAFRAAWLARYQAPATTGVAWKEYPNTTALLLASGLRPRSITVCELDETKRDELERHLASAASGDHVVHGDWRAAKLVPSTGPAFVMLDPYRVHVKHEAKSDEPGYITVDRIRGALSKLGVLTRPRTAGSPPAVVTIFSFSESAPDTTHRVLTAELAGRWGWIIARAKEPEPHARDKSKTVWHQGWWCASHPDVAADLDLQARWERWRR